MLREDIIRTDHFVNNCNNNGRKIKRRFPEFEKAPMLPR